MGRHPNVPQLTKNGTYRCWHPGLKKHIGLGTTDYNEACRIQASYYPGREASPGVSGQNANRPLVVGNGVAGGHMGVMDFDKPEEGKPDASSLLNKWASGGQPAATPPTTVTPEPQPEPSIFSSFSSAVADIVPKPNVPAKGGRPKQGLTPEQSAKLASGLKKIVTNLNVIAVGAGVQMFGKVPAPLDDEEIELLQMGWEMYIDDIFAKAKIKPWHVLLAGNVMIAASMYVGGTPIKKGLPAGDASKAKSASVTPIDGGKKDA